MSFEEAAIWGNDDPQEVDGIDAANASSSRRESQLYNGLGDADWSVADPFKEDEHDSDNVHRNDLGQPESTTTQQEPEKHEIAQEWGSQGSQERLGASHIDETDGFDDFQDASGGENDDGDDFGDFGVEDHEGTFDDQLVSEADASAAPTLPTEHHHDWKPLSFDDQADAFSTARKIREILRYPTENGFQYPFHDGPIARLVQEQIRQVDGPAQVLVKEESRNVWKVLSREPQLKPVDWMRSKTRRTYLIAMGVPINLDELNSTRGEGSLPPLALKLDSNTEDDGVADTNARNKSKGTPKAPELDMDRVKHITVQTEDDLSLLTLPALRDLQREMEQMTRQASTVLTYYLSQRESHTADAEMYNGLIRDLVSGAAKRVTATHSSGSASRRVSVRTGAATSNSGRSSPAVGSTKASSPKI